MIGICGDQDARTFAGTVRVIVAELDPALAIPDLKTIDQLERDRSAPQRFSAVSIRIGPGLSCRSSQLSTIIVLPSLAVPVRGR